MMPRTAADSTTTIDIDPNNSVLGKLTLLLGAFTRGASELSLSDLSRRSGLHKPTVHRLCSELLHWGYLERDGTRYRLGLRLFEIGLRAGDQWALLDAARPAMIDLQRGSGGAVHLAVCTDAEVLYIEEITDRTQTEPLHVAHRMPMHCTAAGKVLLSNAGPELVRRVVAAGLPRLTPYTVTHPNRLIMTLTQVRKAGYATEFEEARRGYLSVAAPVRSAAGQVISALSLTAPTVRANVSMLTRSVLRHAGDISARLARPPGSTSCLQE